MNELDLKLAQRVVHLLNELLKEDPKAINQLINQRVSCSEKIAPHPTVQVSHTELTGYTLGVLGLLNGLCGIYPDGMGPVVAIYNEDSLLIERFTLYTPPPPSK